MQQGDITVASMNAGCDGYPAEVPGELTNQKAPRSTIVMEVMSAPRLNTGKVIKIVVRMEIQHQTNQKATVNCATNFNLYLLY